MIVALVCVAADGASAETITVTNLNDSGAGSLREALSQAASGATIIVPAGTIFLTSGPLVIDKSLTIDGAGSSATALSGDMKSRVVEVSGAAVAATISGVQIIEGKPAPVEDKADHTFEVFGGGVSVAGASLTLSHVLVTENEANTNGETGGISEGGGVYASAESSLTLLDTLVSDNGALAEGGVHDGGVAEGGGIAARGRLTIRGGAIEGNTSDASGTESATLAEAGGVAFVEFAETQTATIEDASITGNEVIDSGLGAATGGGDAQGGGMLLVDGASVTLADDTVTDNSAIADGGSDAEGGFASGGGMILAESPVTTVVNLTVSANAARANGSGSAKGGNVFGGGIYTDEHVSVTNSTIVANTAEASGPGGDGTFQGGNVSDGGIRFENTIVAAGVGASGSENCLLVDPAASSSAGGNIDSLDQCGFHAPGDHVNTNPMLGALQPNGGPVQTIAPLPGSPAIEGGQNSGCPGTDARGVLRPAGPACDVGAFELATPSATTGSATNVGLTAATLAGSARNPDLAGGEVEFQYGTTSAYGTTTAAQTIGATVAQAPFTAAVTGLAPSTTYHFRIVVKNAIGTAFGADETVTTASSPAPVSISTGPPQLPAPLTIVGALRPAASGTSLSLTLTCKGPTACPVTVAATTTEQLRHGRVVALSASRPRTRTVVVASASLTIAAGKVKVVTLRLNTTGRRLEARFKRLPVTLTVFVTEQGHRTLVKRVRLVLAPRPPHKHKP